MRYAPAVKQWAEEREPRAHALVGETTFSITMVEGGTGINTIPAECVAQFDWRLHPADDPEGARSDLLRHLEASSPLELSKVLLFDWGLDTDPAEPVVLAARKAARRATGVEAVGGIRGGTDASKFSRAGVPAVVFGPGSIAQAHTANEWIDLEEVARAVDAIVALCEALAEDLHDDRRRA